MLTIFSPLPASLSLEIPFKQNYEMKKESCFKIILDNVATSLKMMRVMESKNCKSHFLGV